MRRVMIFSQRRGRLARRHRRAGAIVAALFAMAMSNAPAAGQQQPQQPAPASETGLPSAAVVNAASSASWPTLYRVNTTDPVVFITIDDGYTRTQAAYDAIRSRGWPVTNFVLPGPLSANPGYYESIGNPSTFGTHGTSHRDLATLSLNDQIADICGGAAEVQRITGQRAGWFRAPYGSYNSNTLAAAAACGFPGTVLWDVTVNGSVISTASGTGIHAGDIILMHYLPDLAQSISALGSELARRGLRPARFDSYVPPVGPPPPPKHAGVLVSNACSGVAQGGPYLFGDPGDTIIVGHWQSPGPDSIGVYRPSEAAFYLAAKPSDTAAFRRIRFGDLGDVPITGDWDGNGTTDVGVARPWMSPPRAFLRHDDGTVAQIFIGDPGDVIVTGDWDGDGTTTVGVYRGSRWLLSNRTSGWASADAGDIHFGSGRGELPVTGDWTGEGTTGIGVYQFGSGPSDPNRLTYHFAKDLTAYPATAQQCPFGAPGDIPIVGDWNGDGTVTNGVIRQYVY